MKKKKFKLKCKKCGILVAEIEDLADAKYFSGRCLKCQIEMSFAPLIKEFVKKKGKWGKWEGHLKFH